MESSSRRLREHYYIRGRKDFGNIAVYPQLGSPLSLTRAEFLIRQPLDYGHSELTHIKIDDCREQAFTYITSLHQFQGEAPRSNEREGDFTTITNR